jgi:hypothetical protein
VPKSLSGWLQVVAVTYMMIGGLHSFYFWLTVSWVDCLSAKGLVAGYCNVGEGLSHPLVVFAWPLYWLATTESSLQYLTGKDRSDFIDGVTNSCVRAKDRNRVAAQMPTPILTQYCRCYAGGLADGASKKQLKDDDDAVLNPIMQAAAKRCLEETGTSWLNSN